MRWQPPAKQAKPYEVQVCHDATGWTTESVHPNLRAAMGRANELKVMGWGSSAIRCRPVTLMAV